MQAEAGRRKTGAFVAGGITVIVLGALFAFQDVREQLGFHSHSAIGTVGGGRSVQPAPVKKGLPVRRETLEAGLNLNGFNFQFQPDKPVRGFPAVRAVNHGTLPIAEIIGEGANPVAATVLTAINVHHLSKTDKQTLPLQNLLTAVLPSWGDRDAWLLKAIPQARTQGRVGISFGDVNVALDHVRRPGIKVDLYELTVSSYPFPIQR